MEAVVDGLSGCVVWLDLTDGPMRLRFMPTNVLNASPNALAECAEKKL